MAIDTGSTSVSHWRPFSIAVSATSVMCAVFAYILMLARRWARGDVADPEVSADDYLKLAA
eukprot:CAMPEP_0117550084 /NCGR_PEP_ID=MMETSP0784-20121206/48496_1 /TAXON_ID=39447 /ORGANISM="" /LENGTH=60 /DNA_ID=CAMNT_0005347087 /DNA_START=278 /DNA_END=460 /DNA_ORIENTATION=+